MIPIALVMTLSFAAAPVKPARVEGSATVLRPWCSGTRPPDDFEARPVPDTRALVVRRGEKNSRRKVRATIQPDATGAFSVTLPEGTWCLVPKDRPSRPPRGEADLACLQDAWDACVAVIHVDGTALEPLQLNRVEDCNWNRPCARGGPPRAQ